MITLNKPRAKILLVFVARCSIVYLGVSYSLGQARTGSAQGEGDGAGKGGGGRVPPLFEQLINKIKYSGTLIQKRAKELAKYVHYNEIRQLISRFFFILPYVLL